MKAWTIQGGEQDARVSADVRRVEDTVTVTIEGVTRSFTARRDGEGWRLSEVLADGVGEHRHVVSRELGGGAEVVIDGRRRVVVTARPGAGAVAHIVTPPMPATVSRLLVAEGASVQAGDPLVAVTAMKMEVTLRAPRAGVAHINVAVGDKVMPGDVLVDVVASVEGA